MTIKIILWAVFLSAAASVGRAEPMDSSISPEDEIFVSSESSSAFAVEEAPAAGPLRIVHPVEGARLPFLKSTFVHGSADPKGRLTLNGKEVSIHRNGGFLAMMDFSTGTFLIQAELKSGAAVYGLLRRVFVNPPPSVSPVSPLVLDFIKPDVDMDVFPGDEISIQAKGSPGMTAEFQWEGEKKKRPMTESENGVKGVYRGIYVVGYADRFQNSRVKIQLTDPRKGKKISQFGPGRVSVLSPEVPWSVEVSTDLGILRSGPSLSNGDKGGYLMFPPLGVRLDVVGRRGKELRVRLSSTLRGWIGEEEVRALPPGAPPARTTAGSVTVENRPPHVLTRLSLGQKVPFEVRVSPDGTGADVLLYGVRSNTDWIHYPSGNKIVDSVQWFQDEADVYRLRVNTRPKSWWGYDARFENSTFVLELRAPPAGFSKARPLQGLTVVVDAGHSSDSGAVGPTGLLEKNANLSIARCLEKKLAAEKARVVMLRQGNEHVPLYDRPKMAWRARGDVLISVHNNALPDGLNPFERRGYGVYYYHPQSLGLAEAIHDAYGGVFRGKKYPGAKDDGLHYGNLALARTSQMPAVLTESSYMLLPEDEDRLKTRDFQCACAEAIVGGLKKFVFDFRAGENPGKK